MARSPASLPLGLAASALLWSACSAPPHEGALPGGVVQTDTATGDDDTAAGDEGAEGDDGSWGDTADTGEDQGEPLPASLVELSAVQNERIGTLFTVHWTSEVPVRARVKSELSDGRALRTPLSADLATSGTVEVRGLPALRDLELVLQFQDAAGQRGSSLPLALRTGGPPSSLPVFTAEPGDSEEAVVEGWHLLTVITDPESTGKEGAVVILNERGELVWWWMLGAAQDNTVAALSRDGEDVLFISQSRLVRVAFDGSEEEVLVSSSELGVHHHFLELSDGTIALLGMREVDTPDWGPVTSHTLYERAPSGAVREVWTLADDAEVLVRHRPVSEPEAPTAPILGNVNHILYDPADDTYILGLQSEGVVFGLARETGELDWHVDPDHPGAGYAFQGASPWTATHGTEMTGEGFVLFVNATVASPCARVVLARRDLEARTIEQTWAYTGGTCHNVPMLGDVHQLSEDVLAVTWSTSAELEQVDLTGRSVLKLRGSFGQVLGYGRFYDDLYGGL